ncbi:MAG: DUF5123 domain-containing protein, partial [Rikenellaceae bacterium]|nr:DUF5123 domain-containing protein [Rikenellaceae bacterium]
MMYFQAGLFKDILFESSTLWGKGTGSNYCIQFSHSNRISNNDLWTWSLNQTVEFTYCTVYNSARTTQFWNSNQWNTTSGRIKNWATVTYTIFLDCGNGEVICRLRSNNANNVGITCQSNCYWYNGSFPEKETETNWDSSGTAIRTDPGLVDPENGNFTVTGIQQRGVTGDPRWW